MTKEYEVNVAMRINDEVKRLTAENEALREEVERLRNTGKQCNFPIACDYVSELEQERDRMKSALRRFMEIDVDVDASDLRDELWIAQQEEAPAISDSDH